MNKQSPEKPLKSEMNNSSFLDLLIRIIAICL